MTWLPNSALESLRRAADRPDLSGTRYEIVGELGRGGMGTVYRVRDIALGREVALKVLSLSCGEDDAGTRMLAEARILAALEHPGVVPIHDVGTLPDGRTFYAMKLVRGERLDDHVRGLATLAERLRVFERVCEAVAFAHARGVIHRDLKPSNVMVGAYGEVLVLDWGVAKLLSSDGARGARCSVISEGPGDEGTTGHGVVLGTPGFMAPEQADGRTRVDERADVYALGALLLFLIAGEPPPPGFDAARDARIETLLRSAKHAPASLRAVCGKALSLDPATRYDGVAGLARDVTAFLTGLPVSAHPETMLERTARFARKYRTPILLVLAYLLMRVVLLFVRGI